MQGDESARRRLGYEFDSERVAGELATELGRRFDEKRMSELRVYRIVWNSNFLVEAVFSERATEADLASARALLGESGTPVHPDDLKDYKRAETGSVGKWFKKFFGR